MAYVELAEHGGMAPEVAYARAADAAANALRLDPELGEAHCTAGYLKTVREFDWAGAEQEFKQALELTPSNADAHALYGRLCSGLGRYDEAIALQRRAQELDPLAHRLDVVTTLLRAGRYDDAVVGAGNAVELDPGHDRARATLGWAYFLSGRQEEGLAELERAVALPPATRSGWASWAGLRPGGPGGEGAGRSSGSSKCARRAPTCPLPSRVRACGPRRRGSGGGVPGARSGGAHRAGVRSQGLLSVPVSPRASRIPRAAPADRGWSRALPVVRTRGYRSIERAHVLAEHDSCHVGQLGFVRRQLGKTAMSSPEGERGRAGRHPLNPLEETPGWMRSG